MKIKNDYEKMKDFQLMMKNFHLSFVFAKKGSYLYFRDCMYEITGIILAEYEITRKNRHLDSLH